MKRILVDENNLHLVFEITDAGAPRLLHFSALPFDEGALRGENETMRMVEVQLAGQDRPEERHGTKYTASAPGCGLRYQSHTDVQNAFGRLLEFHLLDPATGLAVCCCYQFYTGIAVVRCWSRVENTGGEAQTLEYISSFNLNGVEKEGLLSYDDKMRLHIPHNSWMRELQWQAYSMRELGIAQSQPMEKQRSSKAVNIHNTGNWSTKSYLPMGMLENTETGSGLIWQIEHNGSWHWEISDQTGHLYLQLSGPTEIESHWSKCLQPGEAFVSVPVAVGAALGGFAPALRELTAYRRATRRPNKDNETLGVIFNDYMNCLWAEPTTALELPMIEAAAEIGCEYYCIDAGWYADGYWWDNVGEWLPSQKRFPGGLKEVTDAILAKGMVPGLWLEIESMGINSPKLRDTDDSWFFTRHGKRVYDRSRLQLDFRNPAVREFAAGVIDRLVREYGVGYIKMDYNIEPGIGTEQGADSVGDGMLEHERAYLAWLDDVFARHPDLIIENCSSGGLRMDYALLSRHSIQSTSDQEGYLAYAPIAANAPTGVTPEQAAVWSYPLADGDEEEVVFNMVNAMLLRIHQSGHIINLNPARRELVREGIAYYKTIRQRIRRAHAFWPLGLAGMGDAWISLGLQDDEMNLVAVWRKNSESSQCTLPLPHLKGREVVVRCAYPAYENCAYCWNAAEGTLSVELPLRDSARVFEVVLEG